MNKKIANIISIILNPAIMPLLGIIILFQSKVFFPLDSLKQFYIYLIVVVFSILLPLSLLPLLSSWKLIENIYLNNRKDRFIPMLVSTLCFYLTHFLIIKIDGPRLITLFTFAMSLSSLIILIVTLFWKISVHMTGIGGVTALILTISLTAQKDLFLLLALAILVSGFLASIRLYLQVHSLSQVVAGYLTGFLSIIVTFFYFSG